MPDAPDIASSFINVSYDAGLDTLTASGIATTYEDGSGQVSILPGSFDLTATIDAAGVLSGGSLTIGGDLGGGVTTLLTGGLTAFGFPDPPATGDDIFEFLFAVTGGDLAGAYGGVGSTGGVILALTSDVFDGSFDASFETDGALSDTGVPEPGTLALVLLGCVGLAAAAGRDRRASGRR
jgi:hypothetical protein